MGYFFVIQPGHARIMKRIASRNGLESRIQTDLLLLGKSKEITRRSRVAQRIFQQSGAGMGTASAIGRSLARFQTLAQRLHIGIRSIRVDPTSANANRSPLLARGVHLALLGSFRNELLFLRNMTRFKGLAIRLDAASFSVEGSRADVIAKASFSLLSSLPTREGKR